MHRFNLLFQQAGGGHLVERKIDVLYGRRLEPFAF
jgi:hypothetical protein